MERFARVEFEHVADAVRERKCVRSLVGEALGAEPFVLGARDVERAFVLAAEARADELFR